MIYSGKKSHGLTRGAGVVGQGTHRVRNQQGRDGNKHVGLGAQFEVEALTNYTEGVVLLGLLPKGSACGKKDKSILRGVEGGNSLFSYRREPAGELDRRHKGDLGLERN